MPLRLRNSVPTVRLSVCGEELGMGSTGDQISRPHREVMQRSHCVDGSLDPLARANEHPRQDDGSIRAVRHHTSSRDGGTMGNGRHFASVNVEAITQSNPGRLRHHHHSVGEGGDFVQHNPLMRRWVSEDRVGDHDGGDVEAAEDLEDVFPVGASIEAVLVLYHRDVELVQRVRGRTSERARPLTRWPTTRSPCGGSIAGVVQDPHDAHFGMVRRQTGGQGGGEGGQTARGRGEGAENPQRASAAFQAIDGQIRDAPRSSSKRLGRGVEPARGDVGQDGRPAQARRLSQGDENLIVPWIGATRFVGSCRRRLVASAGTIRAGSGDQSLVERVERSEIGSLPAL